MSQQPTARRDDPFRWVLDVSAMLMVNPGEQASLQRVAKAIGESSNVSGADLRSYDAETQCLTQQACWELDGLSDEQKGLLGMPLPLQEIPEHQRLISTRQVLELRGGDANLAAAEREWLARQGIQTALHVPLVIGSELVGVLLISEKRYPRSFMSMEVERFQKLAAMSAAALRNARSFVQTQKQTRRVDALLELARVLATAKEPHEAICAGASVIAQSMQAVRMALYRRSSDTHALSLVTRQPANPGEDQAEAVWLTSLQAALPPTSPEVLRSTDAATPADLLALMQRGGEVTRLHLPLICRMELGGLLTLAWPDAVVLSAKELEYAQSAAELLAVAMENARLEASAG